MIRDHSRSDKRSAFTMIELLVVILIIAILVSLVSSAVVKAMQKIPEVQTRTEISEIDLALRAFMTDYNLTEPPPSLLILNEATPLAPSPLDNGRSANFLTQLFGKNLGAGQPFVDWNGDGVANGPWTLQGQECLVFYLGGIPNVLAMAGGAPPAPQGFSTNNINPSATSARRKGPYFTFVTPRLRPVPLANGAFLVYLDPWLAKSGPFYSSLGGSPYIYFSSYGNNNGYSVTDCNLVTYTDTLGTHIALPYWLAQTPTNPPIPTQYNNSNTYQIISAGKDGKFGYNPSFLPGANNLWSPSSGAQGTGADDQTNFSGSLLGAGQS